MAVIPLEFVQGLFQGFADVSNTGDAIYYYCDGWSDFILFDNSLRGFAAAQFILRCYLVKQINSYFSQGCLTGRFQKSVSARLSDFGLCLEDDDIDLMWFSVTIFDEGILPVRQSNTG